MSTYRYWLTFLLPNASCSWIFHAARNSFHSRDTLSHHMISWGIGRVCSVFSTVKTLIPSKVLKSKRCKKSMTFSYMDNSLETSSFIGIKHMHGSRHGYDSEIYSIQLGLRTFWFGSAHDSQWLYNNWFKSAHDSKWISEIWFKSTHDSKSVQKQWFKSTNDSKNFP